MMAQLYRGRSLITGRPIVVLATFPTANIKTGLMVQTWIMPVASHPVESYSDGSMRDVCGDCPLTQLCYVRREQGPAAIWKSWRAGADLVSAENFLGLGWRFGSWGDPGAVPVAIWHRAARLARCVTGYTHQWRKRPALKAYCMASVETEHDQAEAARRGWRTYYVSAQPDATGRGVVQCPHETHGLQCIECKLCNGGSGPHVVAQLRGAPAHVSHFTRTLDN